MVEINKFKKLFVAFYAPYNHDGAISTAAAINEARFYEDAGIKGLYLNGSSGEGFLLNIEERKKIVEAILGEFKGKMTVIVHVGATSTKDSVELAKHAAEWGADALAAVPVLIYKLPEKSIEYHWKAIIENTSLPFIIYNIPQLTGYELSLKLLQKMVQNPKVIGVKNSSASAFQIEQYKKVGGKNFIVFNGVDEQYLAGRIMGAEAGIGGTYGVMPEMFLEMERLYNKGEIREAQIWQIRINEIICGLLSFNCLYAATKGILRLRGIDIGSTRTPMLPIELSDIEKLEKIYKKIMDYTSLIK